VKIGLISFRPLLFVLPFSISFWFRWFRFHFVDFVSFRFVSFLLISFRFVFVDFVSFRFVFVDFVSFLFRFALYMYPKIKHLLLLLLLLLYSHILVVSCIGRGNRCTRRKLLTCYKTSAIFITLSCIEYTSLRVWIESTTVVVTDVDCMCKSYYQI